MESLDKKIHAVLLWRAEPMTLKSLASSLGVSREAAADGVAALESSLVGSGVVLVRKDDAVMIGTAPEHSELIERLAKEELDRDLGKAGLETLSIVLYFGPITRSEIDYIRGVNSTFILRSMMVRGLVERVTNEKDQRSFLYKPTFQLLSFLGVTDVRKLPEYDAVHGELEAFKAAQDEKEREARAAETEKSVV